MVANEGHSGRLHLPCLGNRNPVKKGIGGMGVGRRPTPIPPFIPP